MKGLKKKDKKKIGLSVIIPVYNSEKTICSCIRSIIEQADDGVEIIVVDDRSSDRSAELAGSFKKVRLFVMVRNSGPAAARNYGARMARGSILFFLDSDVILKEGAVKAIREQHSANGEVAVSGLYAKKPANKGFIAEFLGLWKYYAWMRHKKRYITNFTGSIVTVKKDIFLKLGGFDARYKGADVEDYEFGYRLLKNHRLRLDTRIQGYHHFPGFWSLYWNYYKRAAQWFSLFSKRKKFDTGAASKESGVANLLGFSFITSLLLLPFLNNAYLLSLMLLIAYIILMRDFLVFCMKEKGAIFTVRATGLSLVLSTSIIFGIVRSLAFIALGKNGKNNKL